MKTLLALLLILGFTIPLHAQLVKKKTKKVGDYKEVYYLNRSTRMPHGYYTKTHLDTKIKSVSGEFVNGKHYGIWTFNDAETGKIQLEYDFTNNSLIYIDNEILADSFLVKKNNTYVFTKVDRPLVFIGYKNEESDILHSAFRVPSNVRELGKREQIVLAVFVDSKGNITKSKVVNSTNSEFEEQVRKKVQLLDKRFLPAIKDGKTVESVFYVNVSIIQQTDEIPEKTLTPPYLNDIVLTYRYSKKSPPAFNFPHVVLPFGTDGKEVSTLK